MPRLFGADTTYAFIRPRRKVVRTKTVDTTTGTISASLPELTASMAGASSASGTLSATLSEMAASLSGSGQTAGTLSASIPSLDMQAAGSTLAQGTLSATLAELQSDIDGSATSQGGLSAILSDIIANIQGTHIPAAVLQASVPDLVAEVDGQATASGLLSASLSEISAAFTGIVDVEGGSFVAVIPGMEADFDGSSLSTGLMSASLPELQVAISGEIQQIIGTLSSTIPTLQVQLAGQVASSGVLEADIPDLSMGFAGEVEIDAAGTLVIVLAPFIMGANSRRYRQMEQQRRLTREFIASNPVYIALVPVTRERKPSGGVSMQPGVPRPVQMFRLIPMSHTERPVRSSSAAASADDGVQRRYDYTLLGEWDAVMQENDQWEMPDGQILVVDSVVSYNGYERKGMITSYGRRPEHA